MFVLLMASAIYVVDISLKADQEPPKQDIASDEYISSISTEEGVFKRSEYGLEYGNMSNEDRRSLEEYYKNRAFPGAPPIIPHKLLGEQGIGGKACLQCHENGGFVGQFNAFAPVTPHPELINCKQCHVPSRVKNQFSQTNWKKFAHPDIHQSALPGSPPVIPHTLQLRENCLACHAGPAAPQEILVSHPERINCRQCHVPGNSELTIEWDSTSQWTKSKIEWASKQ